jgi:hypothetical protein
MPETPLPITALGEPYVRLEARFSEFPTREEVSERIRIFKPRSLANLDSKGRGPTGRLVYAGKICYPRDQVIFWFAYLAEPPKSRKFHTPEPESTAIAASAAERK